MMLKSNLHYIGTMSEVVEISGIHNFISLKKGNVPTGVREQKPKTYNTLRLPQN